MQSRKLSAVEALTSTLVGLLYAFALQYIICKVYNIPLSGNDNAILVGWMTVASIARTYVMRRVFEWIPRWWKQLWCNHSFDFVDTKDDVIIQQCEHCEKVVKDRYGF